MTNTLLCEYGILIRFLALPICSKNFMFRRLINYLMKKCFLFLSVVILSMNPLATVQAEDKVIPQSGRVTIGALSSMTAYISHVAIGRLAAIKITSKDVAIKTAQDAGGIMGGLGEVVKHLKKTKNAVPATEHPALDKLIESNELAHQQAKALVKLITIKSGKGDTTEAQANYEKLRTEAAKSISHFGIPLQMLK